MRDQDERDDQPSDQQKEWIHLAQRVRVQLAAHVNNMSAMQPLELHQFVSAINDAYWLEQNARLFDRRLSQEEKPSWM